MRVCVCVCVCVCFFPFCFESGMWDFIVLVPVYLLTEKGYVLTTESEKQVKKMFL